MSLSPNAANVDAGNSLSVNIVLDTKGQATYGVDAVLSYNPFLMEVQDANSTAGGVQIAAGTLMPTVTYNAADAAAGRILFSQVPAPGTAYNGSGVLATVNFRAAAAGSAAVSFAFAPGNRTDSNVAFNGTDVLASVSNGMYSISGPVSPPPPPGGGPSGGQQSFSCTKEWQCAEWSACANNGSTRTCSFVDVPQYTLTTQCPVQSKAPYTSMRCTPDMTTDKIAANCNDGMRNQDEEGVDCGGLCKPCKDQGSASAESPANFPRLEPDLQTGEAQAFAEFVAIFASYAAICLIVLGTGVFLFFGLRRKGPAKTAGAQEARDEPGRGPDKEKPAGANEKPRPEKPGMAKRPEGMDQRTYDSVASYIREARSRGLGDEYIRKSLLRAGIDPDVADSFLREY